MTRFVTTAMLLLFSIHPSCFNSFSVPITRTTVSLSASVAINEGNASNGTLASLEENTISTNLRTDYDFPWTEKQVWALSDSLRRFTVQVHVKDETMQTFILWRTMAKEVVELAGYPLPFLIERQMELLNDNHTESSEKVTSIQTSRIILPYLDEYEFTTSGGISGAAFGVPGVAEGTRIETASLDNVKETLPKGFVQTACSVLYELGSPRQQDEGSRAGSFVSSAKNAVQDYSRTGEMEQVGPLDRELVQLGALTGVLLVGASAVATLSHHLTVNVFWV